MWSVADLADALESGLRDASDALDQEYAVYGLDALDELALHPVLSQCFETVGFGVHREQRYPADRMTRNASIGERCDLVLTEDARPLANELAEPGLFDPSDTAMPDEAFWLEVKTVAQFTTEGPNRTYSGQLLSRVRTDVGKLSKDPDILHAGLLVVLFARDESVAEHDLNVWLSQCLDRGLPVASPSKRVIPIADRMGNSVCATALYPVSHL